MTSSTIEKLLPQLAFHGERLSAQGEAIHTLSENASAEVASVLSPALLVGQTVAKAAQTAFAWIMDSAEFVTFSLTLQSKVAQQASAWHNLRGGLGKIAFVRRFPNIKQLQRGDGISLEEALTTTASAGISFGDFWGISIYGQASLERLLNVDLALSRDIDCDPITEMGIILKEVGIRIPVVPTALDAIRNARTIQYSDLLMAEGLSISIQGGETLPSIAKRYLGDAEQWEALAELNSLRAPYISTNALDQLGAVVGQRTLAAATTIGATVAKFTSVSGLYKDQRIRFTAGISDQVLTIKSVELAPQEIHFTETFATAFPSFSVATVYNPTYDIQGRVLQPGDMLLLPGFNGSRSRTLVQQKAVVSPERLYGTDIQLTQGNFFVTEGDLALVSGAKNLTQALQHRFRVPRGQLLAHPLYGTGLGDFIGWKNKPFYLFLAEVAAQQTVLRDPRVLTIDQFSSEMNGDQLTIDMVVRTQNQDQFPVPRFTIDVRG